jgi:hypothetical protein
LKPFRLHIRQPGQVLIVFVGPFFSHSNEFQGCGVVHAGKGPEFIEIGPVQIDFQGLLKARLGIAMMENLGWDIGLSDLVAPGLLRLQKNNQADQ